MTHLSALLSKNWILWKRSCCCSSLEILLPVVFAAILITARTSIEYKNLPEKAYIIEQEGEDVPRPLPPNMSGYTAGSNQDLDQLLKTLPQMKNCKTTKNYQGDSYRNGAIGLGPSGNPMAEKIADYFLNYYGYEIRWFDNNSQINQYVRNSDYSNLQLNKSALCLGIMLENNTNDQYSYVLKFNTSDTTDYIELPQNKLNKIDPIKFEDQENSYLYFKYGVLTIQNWIDNLIVQSYDSQVTITPEFSYVHSAPHRYDQFSLFLNGSFGIYLILPIMIIYLRMTHSLIYEKEKKLREGMKMMGLSNTSFYLSWVIQYALIYAIVAIISTAVLKSMIFPETSWGVLFLNFWLFYMVLIAQSLFLQVFFTRSLLGLIFAIVFFLLNFMVTNIVGSRNVPNSRYWGASVCAHAATSYSFDVISTFESQGKGVTFNDLEVSVNNYYILMAWIMHILNFGFYFLLAIYLDQVFPNEWGVKKHPLFFLGFSHNNNNQIGIMRSSSKVQQQGEEKYEDVELALQQQEQRNEALIIKGLCKSYSNGKKAVSHLNLSMYQNQIFALLGHNGAGKTTTISMLTGLLDITEGSAIAYGFDVENQIQELRHIMGVCPQHDILFDNLTVKEHLQMFATFKGMKSSDIPDQVSKIIEDVDLLDKTDYLAKNLSGGQKRRLSVAIAFIGDSKLIYLDEPTSGMDTSARRFIWEMLKNYKEDRIIVLTTHFMDEADFLGDRIGIMGEGKLMCSGSSVFLKNKFGVGYNLTIVKETTQVDSEPIIKLIHSQIKEVAILSNVSAEISFQLPLKQIALFPALFQALDKNLKQLQITSYGISNTTLEEVFLKVAKIGAGHQQVEDIIKEDNQMEIQVDDFDLNTVRITNFCLLFKQHILALMLKRARVFRRDPKSLVCEVFLPVLIVIAGLSIMTIKFFNDDISLIISPTSLYGNMELQSYLGGDTQGNSLLQKFSSQWQFQQLPEDLATADLEYYKIFNRYQSPGWFYMQNALAKEYRYIFFTNTVFLQGHMILLNGMNQAILRKVSNKGDSSITVTLDPFPLTKQENSLEDAVAGYNGAFIFSIGMAFIPASIISFIVREREINIKHQQLVSGVSTLAYWLSNWILDIVKHIVPSVLCALMVIAFDISAMIKDGNYGAMWIFFFLYGWAIIPFSYLTSFLFKVPGNSMLVSFFINLLLGSIISIVIYILITIESTRDAANIITWILRPFPSFSFAMGLMKATNKEFFQRIFTDDPNIPSTYDMSIAGTDMLFLFCSGIFYFIVVFIVEIFEDNGMLQKLGSGEDQILYTPKVFDEDVKREADLCQDYAPNTKAVIVRNLRKVFMLEEKNKHKVAVDNISFSVQNGEVFGLLGVNGAGKTTTFKILSGELKPTSGQAYVAGHSVIDNIDQARKNIGYCPQFDALLENLTVIEHLELFAAIKGIPKDRQSALVQQKMHEMDLKRFEYIEAGQLSGGNKRKLSVAIAMIGNPPIVFLDEPSTGMDPEARRFMWDVISKIATKRKQSSIILTTHSMEEAEALSTKIAIQVDGNLRCFGPVQHVKNKYGQGYELEVKLQKPTDNELNQMLQTMKIERNTKIDRNQIESILNTIQHSELILEIKQRGVGSHIYNDLRKAGGLNSETLAEFIIVEQMGQQLKQFIQNNLGENEMIEHFQTFFRIRLLANNSAGKLFDAFEKNKQLLKISQYSIKQASIEQIFNIFAKQDLKTRDQQQIKIEEQKPLIPD